MRASLEHFAWAKPVDGYVWEEAEVINESVFTPQPHRNDVNETRFLRWRDRGSQAVPLTPLFENPTLFNEFASLPSTEDSFLRFANAYGWLGVSQLLKGDVEVNEEGKAIRTIRFTDPRAHGEPLWRWKAAHMALANVSEVLQAIMTDDLAALKERFDVTADAAYYELPNELGPGGELVCGEKPLVRPALWKWGKEGRTELESLKRFASAWAQKRINDALGDTGNGTSTSDGSY